jgi:catechol 2,3-dioxygenase-like lactoylglutathione lyase family enzyme
MSTNYPVNPRVRAFGKARIDIAQRARSREDWDKLWKHPIHSFPFAWGDCWKQCVEYKVDDFAAEVGFFIDILGLPVNAFDPGYAMFTSPHGDFFFAIVPATEDNPSTPPDALRLQFMVADILATTQELESRGIEFEQPPQPCQPGSSLYIGYFRTPHGICVDLWGMVKAEKSTYAASEDEEADEEEEEDLLDELEDEEDEEEEFFPGLDDNDSKENEEEVKPIPPTRVPLPLEDTEEDDDLDDLDDIDDTEDIDESDDVEYVDVDEP